MKCTPSKRIRVPTDRAHNRLKHHRSASTRHDKLTVHHEATVLAAALNERP
ncbi:hypothetical protein ACFU99_42075 [Streptomyces sp. NPDC057654]|uniref:hypothetical protein n=1 Tax=Streptomyces sp. NPDC057654 TaxID=3346196 RepID=UPI0036C12DB8